MASLEIDSFVKKFKALCESGRSANLAVSSKDGKVSINLRVDLGVLQQQDQQPHHPPHKHSRYGPAQERRRERRAAARKAAAVEAESALSPEELELLELAEDAKSVKDSADANATVKAKIKEQENRNATLKNEEAAKTSVKEVNDEVCPDSEYESKSPPKEDPRTPRSPTVEPPPPVRDRTLGGIDYYLLSYEDPPYEDEHYEFFPS